MSEIVVEFACPFCSEPIRAYTGHNHGVCIDCGLSAPLNVLKGLVRAEASAFGLKVGDRLRYTGDNGLHHVRAFVDGRIVLRDWWPRKQRWHYHLIHPFEFERGHYELDKQQRGVREEDSDESV